MKKVLKWIGIVLGGLVGLIVVAAVVLMTIGNSLLNQSFEVTPEEVVIPTDADALARGEYLFSIECQGCHGPQGEGSVMVDDGALGYFPAPNITSGGHVANYSGADFVRSIRHGVNPEGRGLVIMPAISFWNMSDDDLGSVIAYLNSLPASNNTYDETRYGPLAKILTGAGIADFVSADSLDHNSRPPVIERGATAAYGEYLVNISDCRLCHGPELNGGPHPEPGGPLGPNLTPGGELLVWTTEDFITTIRTGVTPSGHEIDSKAMPWKDFANFVDDDLTAIFLYLQSLDKLETAQ